MRRAATTTLAAVGLALAIAGTALALSYKTGTYAAGNPATGAGVQIRVHRGSFSVRVIRYPETCTYGSQTGTDYFTFRSGSSASLTGRITQHRHFSGTYRSSAGVASVSGHIHGGRLTVIGTEHGPYNPGSTATPNFCRGSHTFHATLRAG